MGKKREKKKIKKKESKEVKERSHLKEKGIDKHGSPLEDISVQNIGIFSHPGSPERYGRHRKRKPTIDIDPIGMSSTRREDKDKEWEELKDEQGEKRKENKKRKSKKRKER